MSDKQIALKYIEENELFVDEEELDNWFNHGQLLREAVANDDEEKFSCVMGDLDNASVQKNGYNYMSMYVPMSKQKFKDLREKAFGDGWEEVDKLSGWD